MSSIIQFVENNGRYNTNHSQSNTYIANTKETRANTARAIANATQAMTIWENIEVGVDDEAESLSVSFSLYDSMQQIKLFLEYSLNPSEEQKEIIRLAETKRQEIITKGLPNEKNHPEAFYTSRSLSQLTQQANSSLAGSNYRDTSAMIWQMRND
nr:7183_t:CDS:2 [Entrophospora candida]